MKKAKHAYQSRKKSAKQRGIPFLISFEDWLDIWISSGHWEERGRGKDKYCMSRIGDLGAYEAGNVFIQSNSQNVRDAIARPEFKAKISGDNNHKAKLSKEQVDSIFSSSLPRKELAELYGVSQATISLIKNGKHYHQKPNAEIRIPYVPSFPFAPAGPAGPSFPAGPAAPSAPGIPCGP